MEYMELITQIGFPIAMCLLLWQYIKETQEKHKQEIDKLSEAINNNTNVIARLLAKFEND